MNQRILTIDIMRGLTLFLMLFVNDLYMPGVPWWLGHTKAEFDGMGLADWVFPGFLFMVGMAVPFAIQSRRKKGASTASIVYHIFVRSVSLIFIGVLMINTSRINPELTGLPKYLWAILVYVCIFLIWNLYQNTNRKWALILKGIGWTGLAVLLFLFRAGTPEETSWLETSWWGILGLIGWGYLSTSLLYLLTKDKLLYVGLFVLLFLTLNILSGLDLLNFLNPVKPILGVVINGNTPLIVATGLFFSLLIRKIGFGNSKKIIITGAALGSFFLLFGFVLRNWFIVSKIMGTPSWAMICNGISVLLFVLLFFVIDVKKMTRWTNVFKPAGQNSLTTYLAPNILYYAIWMSSFHVLFYKQNENMALAIAGSIAWALAMIGFAAVLSKVGIRLKL